MGSTLGSRHGQAADVPRRGRGRVVSLTTRKHPIARDPASQDGPRGLSLLPSTSAGYGLIAPMLAATTAQSSFFWVSVPQMRRSELPVAGLVLVPFQLAEIAIPVF